ncbi:odorant receptor 67c-like isoform X2 [Cephus cinctus]|uniref:Odorant receptor n=1 Tax=Cephus cinctus TaxID=211228 RepID=A0AAJ7BPV9_CEPCN|nr:odorant receptor 67c-like isoform X2 [Cephus cinctus]
MDFSSVNRFNGLVNFVCGNLLPLTDDATKFSKAQKLYSAFTWILEFTYFLVTTFGIFFTTNQRIFQDTTVNQAVVIEILILGFYMNLRRGLIYRLIGQMNSVLINVETLKECVEKTVKPLQRPLKLYTIFATVTVVLFCGSPIYKVFKKDQFSYNDFRIPAYIPGEPYSTGLFIAGILFETLGGFYTILKKASIDIYLIHVITLLTAQYKYLSLELINIINGKNENINKSDLESLDNERNEKIEKTVQIELKKWIRHREVVMEIGKILKNLLVLNVVYVYLNCIFRFCFLGFLLISSSGDYFIQALVCSYTVVCLMQVYVLCFCAQNLLDSSTAMTHDAFYEKWYAYGPSTKRIFSMILISNKMECRLSMCGVVDLTLPTFMAVRTCR